ncbi:enhancer of polycomb homolog 1 [Nematolebias whitei]|nr:enhancer of polycomb homolog 1 [Nematolebias whitei]
MKKQQLEQSQQQQINNTTTPASTQILVPKTLDQASAQFAASALVTTDKLLGFKSKEELVLAGGVNGVLTNAAGVFKNLHLTSAAATLHQTNQSTHTTTVTAQTFLQPSSNSNISTPAAAPGAQAAAALGLLGCSAAGATPTTTQVLIGNNICLSVQSAASLAGRHIPRTLGNMPASALKLSTSTNLSGASSMDLSSRDNHDEDKPALNSLADNTVAMEVT